jgi:predicted SAM-dependent methyltransferase
VRILEKMRNRRQRKMRSERDRFLLTDKSVVPKLHLGCGESYLSGYINVDLPREAHTVMTNVRVDLCADVRELFFNESSIGVIRSHHIFEHLDRPNAVAMLINWYRWLKEDGGLIIETPDFEKAARRALAGRSNRAEKAAALRHIFGSHEAAWAYHLEGWYEERFVNTLQRLGYKDIGVLKYSDRMLDNIIVRAHKRQPFMSLSNQLANGVEILRESLVSSQYEQTLLNIWRDKLRAQVLRQKDPSFSFESESTAAMSA